MDYKILLTSTSFDDTPGEHQTLLARQNYALTTLRGPLSEVVMLEVIDQYDGIICGDDEITRAVIKKGVEKNLKIISKYGSGLDKIDLVAAKEFNIPVASCPAVNQTTVAEHVFALLLSYVKNIVEENNLIQDQQWKRLIGRDLFGKTIGIIGTGNVGKEVAKRARAFGMKVVAVDKYPDSNFAKQFDFNYAGSLEELYKQSDVISLNVNLDEHTRNLIDEKAVTLMKDQVIIVNTARAQLVNQNVILAGIKRGKIGGYLTDVLEHEPMEKNHPFLGNKKILITPHIGSRTYENVVKQGSMAVENLINSLKA
jgi:D-3-phosphoglycerate dehydrogenase / 2-oxoglutarate reductase